jgi:hypothetical protein
MQNIPIEGKYCGKCQLVSSNLGCVIYRDILGRALMLTIEKYNVLRCPQCISDKPQILTEKERQAIYDKGYENGKAYQENRSRVL